MFCYSPERFLLEDAMEVEVQVYFAAAILHFAGGYQAVGRELDEGSRGGHVIHYALLLLPSVPGLFNMYCESLFYGQLYILVVHTIQHPISIYTWSPPFSLRAPFRSVHLRLQLLSDYLDIKCFALGRIPEPLDC